MCGILGIAFQNGCEITDPTLVRYTLRELLRETEIRGTDATGVMYVNRREIVVLKAPMAAKDFMATREFSAANLEYLQLLGDKGAISVIGHCRAKTKGSPKDNNNNHPIVTRNIVGVHNGVLSNDEELFARFKAYSREFGRRGRVDSEIIFQLIDHFSTRQSKTTTKSIQSMSRLVEGSYACAMVERKNPFLLWLFRKTGPLTVCNYRKCGVIIFASLESSIKNTMNSVSFQEDFGEPSYVTVPQNQGLCINLFSNSMTRFKLEVKEAMKCGFIT